MENKVIVYSSPTCPMCRGVKMKLDKKGIKYEVCEDTEVLKELGFTHPPVLSVNGVLLSTSEQIRDFLNTDEIPNTNCNVCEVK